jgi:hypothetical protein
LYSEIGDCERKKRKLQRVYCRLYPFICWIIIKQGPSNFSGGHIPHWVNHTYLCLYCIVYLLCSIYIVCFNLLLRDPIFDDVVGVILSEEMQQKITGQTLGNALNMENMGRQKDRGKGSGNCGNSRKGRSKSRFGKIEC